MERTPVELSLTPTIDGTVLSVRYVCPPAEAAAEHAAFCWPVALDVLRRMAESGGG